MKDKNYSKYAPYLDTDSDKPKLVKNAPESARKAFEEAQEADALSNGDKMAEVMKILMGLNNDDKKASKKK